MLQGFGSCPGLVSFLVAHVAYLALFKPGRALVSPPGGAGRHLGRWRGHVRRFGTGGLPAALRLPVAAYVLVIALMAAQAIGRATVLRSGPALRVALGRGATC